MLDEARAHVRAGRIRAGLAGLAAATGGSEWAGPQHALLAGLLVECHLARGDLGAAETAGLALTADLEGTDRAAAIAQHFVGEIASARGEHEQAAAHHEAAGRLGVHLPLEDVPWRASAALARLRQGDVRAAVSLAREHVTEAEKSTSAYAAAQALRTFAAVGADPDPVAVLRAAQGRLAGTVAERLAAQIATDLAGLLVVLRPGRASEEEAVALLRAAEAYAGREELSPLHERVRRLLERLGHPPRATPGEANAKLTVAERRIARLAADGLTNRQIADALVVSVKAVEWHLSRVYRKLEIPSRTGLTSLLG